MSLQIRRGSFAQLQAVTPAEGELLYTTDTKKLYVGDGATRGGIMINSGYTGTTGAGYTGSAGEFGYTGSKGNTGYTGSIGSPGLIGYTGSAGSSDRLVNGSTAVVLGANGTLTTPLLLPVIFTATLDAAHTTGLGTLTGDAWEYEVHFEVSHDGEVVTQINSPVWPMNPGYTNGKEFEFTEADHGIPGYTFTLILDSVDNLGGGTWTATLAVSEPPVYPSTLKSAGAVKLTVSNKNWTFGTNGTLTFPDSLTVANGIIRKASTELVTEGTESETTAIESQIEIASTGVVIAKRTSITYTDGIITAVNNRGSELELNNTRATLKFYTEPAGPDNNEFIQFTTDGGATIETFTEDVGGTTAYGRVSALGNAVQVVAKNFLGTAKTWRFNSDGGLLLPEGGDIISAGALYSDFAAIETGYNDAELAYQDALTQWMTTEEFRPVWFDLPGRLAYAKIIAWTPTTGQPSLPVNLPPLAKDAQDNYNTWQEAIALSKITVSSAEANFDFNSTGKLRVSQGGTIGGGDQATIAAAYAEWQSENADWQALITEGGTDVRPRPWTFAEPSRAERQAVLLSMWEAQQSGAAIDWAPISASFYNQVRAWLSTTVNQDGYEKWKKLTTSVNIVAENKTWTFTNDGKLTLPGGAGLQSVGVTGADGRQSLASTRTDGSLFLTANSPIAGNVFLMGQNNYIISGSDISNGATYKQWVFGGNGKLTAPGNLQVDGGKIILNTGGNAYIESVDYGVNSANSAVNIFGGPYQKIKLRAGFGGTEKFWTFGTDGGLTLPGNVSAQVGNDLSIKTKSNTSITIETPGSGYPTNGGSFFTTGGSGTGMTVQVYSPNGSLQAVSINNPGSGYLDGDIVNVLGGSGTVRVRITQGEWQFGKDGKLTLPKGSTLGETATTTVIAPPGAAAGQSLVLRGTSPTGITSNHPGGFAPGDTITITVNPNNSISVTGTIDYTFTGDFGSASDLGRGTTGTLTFNNQSDAQLTWTIPASSSMTTFTFTLTNGSGIGIGGMSALTLTRTGSSEDSHIHLVAGNPVTTDIYLGDDDQYVKIAKNGGDVVVGTSTNTNHWTFGTDGKTTLPNGTAISNIDPNNIRLVVPIDGNPLSNGTVMQFIDSGSSPNKTSQLLAAGMIVNGPGVVNGVVRSVDAAGMTLTLKSGGAFQTGGTYIFTSPSLGTKVKVGFDTAQVGYQAMFTQDIYGNTTTGLVSGMTIVDVGSNAQLLALIDVNSEFGNAQYNLLSSITIAYSDATTQTFTYVRITDTNGSFIQFGYNATTAGHSFPLIMTTANFAAATPAPEWTFGTDGKLLLPGGNAQIVVENNGVRIGTGNLNTAPSSHIRIGGADHAFEIFGGPPGYSWKFDANSALKLPNAGELRPSTTAYDAALNGWESIRAGYITTTISDNLIPPGGWPMVNWYPTGTTAQYYIDFLLNARTLQSTPGATLIIQPPMSTSFYFEMRAALIAIRDSYDASTKSVSLSSAYGKSWNFGANGSLTLPDASVISSYKPVTVIAQSTSTRTIANNASAAFIPFVDTVDTANSYSADTFTVPYTGYYQVNLSIYFSTSVTLSSGSFLLIDTNLDNTKLVTIFNGAWSGSYLHYSTVIPATTGDSVRIAIRQVSGASIDLASGCRLTIHRVSIS